ALRTMRRVAPLKPRRGTSTRALRAEGTARPPLLTAVVIVKWQRQTQAKDRVLYIFKSDVFFRLQTDVDIKHSAVGWLAVEGHRALLNQPQLSIRTDPVCFK